MDRLKKISADERLKEIYRVIEKTRRDNISMLAHAEREGLKKGMEKAWRMV